MFLIAAFNPFLADCNQFWVNWNKDEFIQEGLKSIQALTPLFVTSHKKPLKKRKIDIYPEWDTVPDPLPSNVLIRFPIKFVIYGNHTAWNWFFEPPDCPLNPNWTSLSEEDQFNPLKKYNFLLPHISYPSLSLEDAIKAWTPSDLDWLSQAFDFCSKSNPEVIEKPQIGQMICKWCQNNNFSNPLFANGKFHALHTPSNQMMLLEDESFTYLLNQIIEDHEPVLNNTNYNIFSHQNFNIKLNLFSK